MKVKRQKRHQADIKAPPAEGAGKILHATWLSDGLLLVAVTPWTEGTRKGSATVMVRGKRVAAEAEGVIYDVPGMPSDPRRALLVVRCASSDCTGEVPDGLVIGSGPDATEFGQAHSIPRLVDLAILMRETVAGLDADTRSRVIQLLVSAAGDRLTGSCAPSASRALFAAREALRERLPRPTIATGYPLGGHIDCFFAVDTNFFYVRGWLASSDSPLKRVTAVSPEGCRIELLERLFCQPRPDLNDLCGAVSEDGDVRKLGFSCYFETPAPSHLGEGWLIEVANASGSESELDMPPPVRHLTRVRQSLLAEFNSEPDNDSSLLLNHIVPALKRVQEHQRDQVRIEKVVQYGTPPPNPTTSIIIPLYGRIDFIEQQMAQFVHDPEISRADVIYILDSPELAQAIFAAAPRLERLYRVPFRVVTLKTNVGFAGANNAGVSQARGRLLLLLNPDVFPDRPGWLGRMVVFYDATPRVGVLGPKLLYEDGAIQHAGLFFYREQESGLWNNEHYFKGLHRTLAPANVTRTVPAVSAACMMIAADLYREFNGLSGLYVHGDYEDTDLCLRLMQAGRDNWYLADVELYHLEGQSYSAGIRKLTARYNRWLHTHLHGSVIERLQARFADGTASGTSAEEFRTP